jgi:hypothetical protein
MLCRGCFATALDTSSILTDLWPVIAPQIALTFIILLEGASGQAFFL